MATREPSRSILVPDNFCVPEIPVSKDARFQRSYGIKLNDIQQEYEKQLDKLKELLNQHKNDLSAEKAKVQRLTDVVTAYRRTTKQVIQIMDDDIKMMDGTN